MKVKFMTMSQCKRIIDAGFVGEHRADGSQTDYVDYQDEILAHYHEMLDSRFSQYVMDQYEMAVEVVKGVFNMRSICLMVILLSYGCANNSRIIKSERHDTYLVGLKCPDGYYLRVSDLMCHYSGPRGIIEKSPGSVKSVSSDKSPKLAKNKIEARVVKVKARKPVKMADRPLRIDCTRVMNQCFKGDL